MGTIGWIILGLFAFGIIKAIIEGLPKPDPSYPVDLKRPIAEPSPPFDRARVPTIDQSMPVFSEKAWDSIKNFEFFTKDKELREHTKYLGEKKEAIDGYYAACLAQYRTARLQLVQQRDALRITLKHAKKITEGLSSAEAKRSDIKLPTPINVPPAPLYETLEQIDRKSGAIASGMGRIGGQIMMGKLPPGVSSGAAAGGAVVLAGAFSIVNFQKSVRHLTASHGEMKAYALRAGDHVEELKVSFNSLLATSQEIYNRDSLLRSMIQDAEGPGVISRYREGSAQPAERKAITTLIAHSMMADGYVVMGD